MQEAAPNYGQLVQQVVPARDVLALLHPGEAFAQITVGTKETWTLLLRDGQIELGRSDTGIAAMTRLVVRIRATLSRRTDGSLPAFATGPPVCRVRRDAGDGPAPLADATALVVAPSGPLLSLPFALLLTRDDGGDDLRAAPWLVRTMSLAHVPSAASFVGLRHAAGGSRAARPWFGFGDFRPVTLAATSRSFPGPACAEAAAAFAALPPLPRSVTELEASRAIVGAEFRPSSCLARRSPPKRYGRRRSKNYRIIHIATHALLPAELECQPQPLIVTSDPRGATTADGAMLLADEVLALDLDADAVILSACNSGGRGGKLAGESLSALARAFFYAGSRSLLATHWNLNDAGRRTTGLRSVARLHAQRRRWPGAIPAFGAARFACRRRERWGPSRGRASVLLGADGFDRRGRRPAYVHRGRAKRAGVAARCVTSAGCTPRSRPNRSRSRPACRPRSDAGFAPRVLLPWSRCPRSAVRLPR